MSGEPNPFSEVEVSCSGCGARTPLSDPNFSEWWEEHGRCLRELYADPPSEIDHRTREILRGGRDG